MSLKVPWAWIIINQIKGLCEKYAILFDFLNYFTGLKISEWYLAILTFLSEKQFLKVMLKTRLQMAAPNFIFQHCRLVYCHLSYGRSTNIAGSLSIRIESRPAISVSRNRLVYWITDLFQSAGLPFMKFVN
jgi:hypothetical protein